MHKLSEIVEKKFIESFDVSDWEIETEEGFMPIISSNKTIQYEVFEVILENNLSIKCADNHILICDDYQEVFAKDSIGKQVRTKSGISKVVSVCRLGYSENMYDLSVDSENHTYYTNDILSHNTTTACVIILHYIIFNSYKTVALLANKGDSAREILDRVKTSFESLPDWLKPGVVEWNKGSVQFENGSKILAASTSSSAIRGKSVSYLYIDETAFVENWDEFYTSVYPTLSSGKETKLLFTSTPNGLNHFYQFWEGAHGAGDEWNGFKYVEVPWNCVPGRDEIWKENTLKAMNYDIEKFEQEFCCSFVGSSGTLIAGWKLKLMKAISPLFCSREGLNKYEEPFNRNKYAIVCDVSRGKGLDYSAFQVIDVTTPRYMQVCTFRSNQILPYDYAHIINRVAKTYNNAHVLIEVNDIGGQVADILFEDLEYDNVLHTESKGRAGKRIAGGFGKGPMKDRGIRTTKTVKAIGCSMLKMMVESDKLVIVDKSTIDELNRFSKKGTSWEAEEGCHDDLVMGLVLFGWLADQNFFKEETGVNIVSALKEKDEDVMVPFFVNNGVDMDDEYERANKEFWSKEKTREDELFDRDFWSST